MSALKTLVPKTRFYVRRGAPKFNSPKVHMSPVFKKQKGKDLGAKPVACSTPQSSQERAAWQG